MHLALNEVREHKNEYHNEPYPQGPNCIAEKAIPLWSFSFCK